MVCCDISSFAVATCEPPRRSADTLKWQINVSVSAGPRGDSPRPDTNMLTKQEDAAGRQTDTQQTHTEERESGLFVKLEDILMMW